MSPGKKPEEEDGDGRKTRKTAKMGFFLSLDAHLCAVFRRIVPTFVSSASSFCCDTHGFFGPDFATLAELILLIPYGQVLPEQSRRKHMRMHRGRIAQQKRAQLNVAPSLPA